jgi:hypothetical protein
MTSRYKETTVRVRNMNGFSEDIFPIDGYSTSGELDLGSYDLLEIDSFNGEDRPDWKSALRSGQNVMNNAHGERVKYSFTPGSMNSTGTSYVLGEDSYTYVPSHIHISNYRGVFVELPPLGYPQDDGSALDKAKALFVSKARRAMSPSQGGIILAEMVRTLRMIRNPAAAIRERLGHYLKDAKKRSKGLKTVKQKNATVAKTWLEYTFGWTPLLHDVEDSMASLSNFLNGFHNGDKIVATGHSNQIVADDGVDRNIAGSTHSYRVRQRNEVHAYVYGAPRFTPDAPPTFRGSFGLRAHDIIPTIWEIIPYSFVADYFTNIGDILSCASYCTSDLAWWGYSQKQKYTVESFDHHDTTVYGGYPPEAQYIGKISPGHARASMEIFDRVRNPSLVPGLRFSIPGSPKPGFNILALLLQARSTRV